MNISSINGNVASPRPANSELPVAEMRQAGTSEKISATRPPTAQPVAQAQSAEVSRQAIEDAVKSVNDFVQPINNSIQFNLDNDSGRTIVKVVDLETKEIIRQFPSEEMLSIAKAIDTMKGLLVQQKA